MRISVFDRMSGALSLIGWLASCVVLAGCAERLSSPTPDGDWAFWPPPPQAPHVQYLMSFGGSRDVIRGGSQFREFLLGKETEESFELDKPYGLAAWKGRIYVTDTRTNCVVVLDFRNSQLRLMGTRGAGKLMKPVGIAIGPEGTKYVADSARNGVYVYDAEDRFQAVFAHEDMKPVGVAIWGDELYVCDLHSSRIEVLDRGTGKNLRVITIASGEGMRPPGPLGITFDGSGNLWVSDVMNCRVLKLSQEGKVLQSIGSLGDGPGSFSRPKQIALDRAGIAYVVDAAFQNVQMFDAKGRLLLSFGSEADQKGSMELPAGICVTESDLDYFQKFAHPAFKIERLILVTNQFGPHKVAVYALGQPKEGMTITRSVLKPGAAVAAPKTGTDPGVPPLPTTMPTTMPSK